MRKMFRYRVTYTDYVYVQEGPNEEEHARYTAQNAIQELINENGFTRHVVVQNLGPEEN